MDKKDIESSLSEFYPSSGVIDDLFLPLNRIERMEGEEGEESSSGLERHNKGYCFVRFTNKEDAKEFLDKFTQAVQDGFKFQGSKYPPIGNFALPKTNREEQPEGQNDRRGPRSGRRDRNGRDQERNGGARDWINEDRGRYSSRSDDI